MASLLTTVCVIIASCLSQQTTGESFLSPSPSLPKVPSSILSVLDNFTRVLNSSTTNTAIPPITPVSTNASALKALNKPSRANGTGISASAGSAQSEPNAKNSNPRSASLNATSSPLLSVNGSGPRQPILNPTIQKPSHNINPPRATNTPRPRQPAQNITTQRPTHNTNPSGTTNTHRPRQPSMPNRSPNLNPNPSTSNSPRAVVEEKTEPAVPDNVTGLLAGQPLDPADNLTVVKMADTRRGFSQEEFEAALREAIARKRRRRKLFRVERVKCVGEKECILGLENEFPRPRGKLEYIEVREFTDEMCDPDRSRMDLICCWDLVEKINHRLEHTRLRTGIRDILGDENCRRFYCDDEECEFIGCKIPECTLPTRPPHPGAESASEEESASTKDPSPLTDDDEEDEEEDGPNTTIIIMSCLLAFFAGIGGAILITWLCRRRAAKHRSSSSSTSSTAYMTGKAASDNTFYEELPDNNTRNEKPANKDTRGGGLSSDNEYTYIPDQASVTSPRHLTPDSVTPSTYNVPGDHLTNRKLPTAPAPRPQHPLAGTGSADQGNPRSETGSYTLATQPGNGKEMKQQYFELEAEKRTSLQEEIPKNDQEYFILEEEKDVVKSGEKAAITERETTPQPPPRRVQNNGSYYSCLGSANPVGQDEEYTALDSDGVARRDYLEILPDYSLQKPIE